jgi:hypothetical protein
MTKINSDKDEQLETYVDRRIKICKGCKYYKLYVCGICGCFIPAKARFKDSACPLNKWTREQ